MDLGSSHGRAPVRNRTNPDADDPVCPSSVLPSGIRSGLFRFFSEQGQQGRRRHHPVPGSDDRSVIHGGKWQHCGCGHGDSGRGTGRCCLDVADGDSWNGHDLRRGFSGDSLPGSHGGRIGRRRPHVLLPVRDQESAGCRDHRWNLRDLGCPRLPSGHREHVPEPVDGARCPAAIRNSAMGIRADHRVSGRTRDNWGYQPNRTGRRKTRAHHDCLLFSRGAGRDSE